VSKKTGKPGYAPACTNKFVRGVCELPRVKCGECPNQAFAHADDAAVLAHLQGRHVMGVYPLLEDETCWFLAVDFDKSTWREDVGAFAETARRLGLPALVERSRSGNGAHVWFFFSEPVPAATARKMGCHLVTETMASHHALSMDSYDRLFGKREVRIFDYVDRDVPVLLRMFEKRLRGYRAIGYARGEAPLGYAEPGEDLVAEYDDDVTRTLDHESATDRSDELTEWLP